ncbi:MAG: DUF5086 family protein [Phyllobacterium sp.]
MPKPLRLFAPLTFLCIFAAAPVTAQHQESVVLSVSPKVTRWADVYKVRPERPDDPYYHVRVIERQKGWRVWQFNELAFHMAVTPKALEASRIGKNARIYSYKDVEIRSAYHRWLDEPTTRSEVLICDTDILSCIKKLPSQ